MAGAVAAERAPHYFISVVRKVAAADSLPHAKPAALVPPRPQRDEQERTPLLLRSPPLAKLQIACVIVASTTQGVHARARGVPTGQLMESAGVIPSVCRYAGTHAQ